MLLINKKQKVVLIICAVLLSLLCYQAIRMVSANLSYYQAFQLKEFWFKNKSLNDMSQYQKALNAIEYANATHTNNPNYLITQGEILEWAGISDIFSKEQQQKKLLQAKTYYLQAAELRPTWPVTWIKLAIVKWRLNEIDQSLIDYLMLAEKFGAHTLDVHRTWVDVGFYLYRSKSPYTVQIIKGLRRHLKLMLKDGRVSVRKSAVAIIKRHHAQKQACNWLSTYEFNTSWHKATLCKINTKTSGVKISK